MRMFCLECGGALKRTFDLKFNAVLGPYLTNNKIAPCQKCLNRVRKEVRAECK